MDDSDIRKEVRKAYGKVAREAGSCGCCGSAPEVTQQIATQLLGYSDEELAAIPKDANLGLGCGNPTALASLRKGDVVLDLGSGAGMDCFLAADRVGKTGRVIGVDMTAEMIDRARQNAQENGCENVEFRLGEIEHLPVADASVDRVISNCVINLSPDKPQVFREAYRALRPGGEMLVSDIVLVAELPEDIASDPDSLAACISGAMKKEDYLAAIRGAGFESVEILREHPAGARQRQEPGREKDHQERPRPLEPKTVEEVKKAAELLASGELDVFATSVHVRATKG